jgi:hypothetical protein
VNIGYILKKGSEPENVLGGKGILYIYEGENDFETEGAKVSKNDKASDGLEVSLKKTSVERSALHIYESRIYHVKYAGQNVSVSIDGKEAEGGIFLEKGDHNISVKANSEGARLDYVLVMDKKMEDIFNGLSNGSLKAGGQVTGYERTGAASYIVNVSVSKPSLLVSTTGYNPLFEAEDGGALARPIPVYSTMNAFPLEPGQRTIQVRYVPQGYMDIGLVFSSLSLLAIIGYLAWRWKHG